MAQSWRWGAAALLVAALMPLACKTGGGGGDSDLAAWSLEGSEEKAKAFIVATVRQSFPKLSADDPELLRFASSLMDQQVAHAEKATYVLDAKAAEGKAALERYIVLAFAVSTNVYEVQNGAKALRYLGPPDQQPTP